MDIHEVKEDPERKIEVLSIQNVMERTMDIYEVEHNSLNSVLLSPPSYLRAVHFSDVDTGKIELVFLKGHSHDHIAPKAELISPDPSNDTILDVTGSPLEVDLKGNESFTKYEKEEVHQWSEEESRHFPTDIKRARYKKNIFLL
ncbi:hypothetical protein JTB14_029675 [Gonioctena quinquepunctata]|nr:hypothetical protein JTB14_029675 [Gonioctena quinquepunctata]